MRYSIVAVMAVMATVLCRGSWAEVRVFYTPPVVSAPMMARAPVIDGLVEPNEWAGAGVMSRFISLGGEAEPVAQTELWVGYDNRHLYVGAIMHDPHPENIRAEATDRDGPVYEDDSLDLFFDPANTGDTYIHFAMNSKGVRYDALGRDATVDYRWEVKTATLESGWSAELVLPFEGEIAPSPGSIWGFGAARFVPHLNERSCSSRMISDFHEPQHFGQLMFMAESTNMKLATLGARSLGNNTAVLIMTNLGHERFTGKANVRVIAQTKHGDYYGAEKLDIQPGKTDIVRVPYKIGQDGTNLVQFSLTDAEGQTLNRTCPYPVDLPPVGLRLAELEKTLAAGLRVWSVLDDSEYKEEARTELEALLDQWRLLNDNYQRNRKRMTLSELAALGDDLADLTAKAEQFRQQIDAYIQGRAVGLMIQPASALADPNLSRGAHRPFALARVDAARNSQTALQLVIAPFPTQPRGG